jgi:hypothetical protein
MTIINNIDNLNKLNEHKLNYNTSFDNQNEISLDLSQELKSIEIVTDFVYNPLRKELILNLSDIYKNKTVILTVNQNNWTKFTETVGKRLKQKGLDNKHILLIQDVIDNNYNIISCTEETYGKVSDNTKNIQQQLSRMNQQKISYSEWQIKLVEKYTNLHNKVNELIPQLWKPLEFALSIKSILNIKDCTLPFIGIILGPPGAVKTLTIELFRDCNFAFYTDNFSAKSFVSHNTSVKREQLQEIDLLPKIKNKLFLTPELSPTFSKRDDELNEILGIITRIADGHGYESDSGAQGHRGYNGEFMFGWLGAAVDIPRKVHKLLGTLGPKLYFYRLVNRESKDEEEYLEKLIDSDNFKTNFLSIKKLLIDYIQWYENSPVVEVSENPEDVIKIKWDSEKDDNRALRYIIRLAKLLAYLRGVVPTWETQNTQGSDYAYTFSTKEEPDRAMIQLRNLARGHASSQGRNYITTNDIPIIIEVVLSTASRERVIIFDFLLKNKGQLTTKEIEESLHITTPTALRTMTEFTALELVNKLSLGSEVNAPIQIQLKQEFDWFLTDEFKKSRDGFGNEYINEYLQEKESKKSKIEIKDINNYEEYKEKISPTLNNFYDIKRQEYLEENYPIMVYNKNNFAIQPY